MALGCAGKKKLTFCKTSSTEHGARRVDLERISMPKKSPLVANANETAVQTACNCNVTTIHTEWVLGAPIHERQPVRMLAGTSKVRTPSNRLHAKQQR